jgi:hypothetical protein
MLQSYCVVNPHGRAWYINKDVFNSLLKRGFLETPEPPTSTKRRIS